MNLMSRNIRRLAYLALPLAVLACGGDLDSDENPLEQPTPNPPVAQVTLRGTVTYDRVPFKSDSYGGLAYAATQPSPARGVVVEALNDNEELLDSTTTDASGGYVLSLPAQTEVMVRVRARLHSSKLGTWDIQVKDNTRGNAAYVLDGAYHSTGTNESQSRDLHAVSGWTGGGYSQPRSAAPFAILDAMYDAVQAIHAVDEQIVMPSLDVFWSPENISTNGRMEDGQIGTSFYSTYGPSIYLLGKENNDSDEYDRSVIQHEFGHYVQDQLGRSESPGGAHDLTVSLDMRVAFSEGWGNAFAAMVGGDPHYRDAFGPQQTMGYTIDVAAKPRVNGWAKEASIQTLFYDLFSSDNNNALGLGFKPIFQTITGEDYSNFDGFTSVFSFKEFLERQLPERADAIDALFQSFNIHGQDAWGKGETNDAGSDITLPIYRQLHPGASVNLCSDVGEHYYNGVEVRRFARFTLPVAGTWRLEASRSHGNLVTTDPELDLYQQGRLVGYSNRSTANRETLEQALPEGTYVAEIYEYANTDGQSTSGGRACFELTLRQIR